MFMDYYENISISDSDKQASSEQNSPTAASTPVAKPDHAASSATSKSVQNPNTSNYAPVAPAPLGQNFTRPKVSLENHNRNLSDVVFEDDKYKLFETSSMSGPFSGPPSLSQERIQFCNRKPLSQKLVCFSWIFYNF